MTMKTTLRTTKRTMRTAVLAVATMATAIGCNSFLDVGTDPNRPTTVGSRQLFVGVQTNIWALYGSDLSRIAAMFTQQAIGTDAQYIPTYQYGITEATTNAQHTALYSAGGLVDVRKLKAQVVEIGDTLFLGIAQVQEALIMTLGADIFGDLVYSQALQGGNPPLDPQMQVYAQILQQLDSAIININNTTAENNAGPQDADLVYFNGNADDPVGDQRARWTALAHSLKARIYMHMAEVDPANYALALAEAQQGILLGINDYQANYSGAAGESNLLFQFTQEQRPGLIAPNEFIVNLMDSLGDPRSSAYFSRTIDTSDGVIDTTFDYATAFVSPNTPQEIMTAAETLLIWAEAAFRTGGDAVAPFNLYRIEAGLPPLNPGTGDALLRNILQQKYIALFHQVEPWNDWKRTCYPNLVPVTAGLSIPSRLFYDANERNTDPNIPPPNQQPRRNENDPPNATDPFGNPCLGTAAG